MIQGRKVVTIGVVLRMHRPLHFFPRALSDATLQNLIQFLSLALTPLLSPFVLPR